MTRAFGREALAHSIPERFRERVALHPERPAVRVDGETIGYLELAVRASRLAAALRAHAAGRSSAVVLLAPQGIDQIVAILGILEAGCWYVPLDLGLAPGTLRDLAHRAEAVAIVATGTTASLAAAIASQGCAVLLADSPAGVAAPIDGVLPDLPGPIPPDALAYVYFTSGTTGTPKGVMDTHRNVLHNILRYTLALGWTDRDRLTLLQPAHFSGAVSNVFGALLNGALLLPYDVSRHGAGGPLVEWLKRERPTVWHSVPSLFRSICVPGARYPDVRVVRLEGDAGAPGDAERFACHFAPDAHLAHGLGATETGLSRQFVLRAGERVDGPVLPIGYPVEEVEVRVADERGEPVGPGATGEIVVRSLYLAPGYWRDPERTGRVFRSDPDGMREYRTGDLGRMHADGCLEHLGRLDHQQRVRGQWVDAALVESRLTRLAGIREAAVSTQRDEQDEVVLAAFLVLTDTVQPTLTALRRALARELPPHAVPSRAYVVDALPLGPTGKLDRRALASPTGRPVPEGSGHVAPRNATEHALAEIWKDVLGLEEVGIDDEFVPLGGDSLKAVQVAIAIEQRMGRRVPPGVLADSPTIASLASRLGARVSHPTRSTLLAIRTTGRRPPLFCVHDLESEPFLFAPLARRLIDRPLYGLRHPSGGGIGDVPRTIPDLALRYLDEIASVVPRGPHRLAGFCFGGVVALEMARQLAARGEPVAMLALINVTPFDLFARVSPAAQRRFRSRWIERLRYLRRKPDALGWISRRVARTVDDMVSRTALAGFRLAPGAVAHPALHRAALRQAFRGHVAPLHPGRVLLVLAEETLPLYADDPAEAWAPLAQGVDIHLLPRDGYAMLMEPDVERLAVLIESALVTS